MYACLCVCMYVQGDEEKFAQTSCHRKTTMTKHTVEPASLVQPVAWLLPRLGGIGFESQLGWPICRSPHSFVRKLWPENGTLPINSRLQARLNNQLSHPIQSTLLYITGSPEGKTAARKTVPTFWHSAEMRHSCEENQIKISLSIAE